MLKKTSHGDGSLEYPQHMFWLRNKKNYYQLQGSKIVLVRLYLRVSQAAGQVNILIFLLKIKFSPCMPINFVMQGKCLFSDISRPELRTILLGPVIAIKTSSKCQWLLQA